VYEPHFPYAPPEPFASRFPGRQLYDGEVAATDAALAPLIDPIVSATSSIPTLIVFTSDHGESLGDHGEASHGIFAYDATLRVPLLVYHASLWRPRVVSSPVSHVDLLPTILDALGVRTPEDLPGRSLVPMIANEDSRERPIYFEALSGMLNRGWAPLRGVVSEGRKYIDLPIPELYDLSRDPREGRNLAESDRARATAMRDLLRRWPAAQAVSRQAEETGEVRERLRSLGYAGASAPARTNYTEEDDPKRLIHLDTLLQEVVTRYLEGDLRSAISTCRDLVARRPGMAVSHLYLAHLERAAGNLPAGIDALRNALALNPADAGTAALLGAYLTESGRAQEAIALLEPFVNREDSDVQVLTTAGLALARAGKNDEAIATLNRARDADPASAGVLVHIGTVHLIADRRAEAQQAFEQALALNPSLARAHSSLGLLAAERGDRASAVAHWQRAVASDPNEFTTVLQTGAALASRGRAEEARLFFEFFVSAAPPSRYASQIARAREWLARTSH
jgi:tetratricopeptide (TPR) repeat protein